MPKILHCADMHFDSPFTAHFTAGEAEMRREDMRETFSRIIEYAGNVDIMLIAGDLFNSSMVSRETIHFLVRKFSEIPNVHIFITAGNHDSLTKNPYYSTVDWGSNVYIFGRDMEFKELEELNTRVYGASFGKPHEDECLLKDFEIDKSKTNILLMHGDVVSSGHPSRYNPITRQQIETCGMNYVALGHKHEYSGINREGEVYWAYSGNPEGRGFDECGKKGFVFGEVSNGAVSLEFVTCSKRNCYETLVDAGLAGSDNEERADYILSEALKHGTADDLYKITLTGEVIPDFPVNVEVLKSKLKSSLYYLKLIDSTITAFDYDEIAKETSMRGQFVRYMMERIYSSNGEDREIVERALRAGLFAMRG